MHLNHPNLTYFEPWVRFNHPIVRQLAFTIASPNLILHFPTEIISHKTLSLHRNEDWQRYFFSYEARLKYLDRYPDELIQFLQQVKSTRLGLRFETLLWFWLQDKNNPYFELLGHSIQHHKDGKTLGEMDFLIRNKVSQRIEHWEVCLKYYLAAADLHLATWIGLNPEDTFAHKLNHLAQHQFQFEHALGYTIDARYTVIKGQLYLPKIHQNLPNWLNNARRLGTWQEHIPDQKQKWRYLTRPEWLCPNKNTRDHQPIKWWNNGLYYAEHGSEFLMLRLVKPSFIYTKSHQEHISTTLHYKQ